MGNNQKGFGVLGILVMMATLFILAIAGWFMWSGQDSTKEKASSAKNFQILVFTKTAGFVHDSIPAGVEAIEKLGAQNNFNVDSSGDASMFNKETLAKYDEVVWLNTTGDVLNKAQQAAFEEYIRGGKGYVGIHSAADTEYEWPWYGGLVGAYFKSHPAHQTAKIAVTDPKHNSTSHLPETWERFDEWYNFKTIPKNVRILLSLDEKSYQGGTMGSTHPIAWCHNYDGGRAWYTGLGHTKESYTEPAFLRHLLGGIKTAAGVEASDCGV